MLFAILGAVAAIVATVTTVTVVKSKKENHNHEKESHSEHACEHKHETMAQIPTVHNHLEHDNVDIGQTFMNALEKSYSHEVKQNHKNRR